jgi:heptaprenyl diphosphate synthase
LRINIEVKTAQGGVGLSVEKHKKKTTAKNNHSKRAAQLGLLAAAALILGWVEHILPVNGAVPGIKLGLSNSAVVFALYTMGGVNALLLVLVKVVLSALLFGGFSGFLYSLLGGLSSLAVMFALYKLPCFSPTGISAAGGAAHIFAQLLTGVVLTETARLWVLLPPLMAAGTLTGALTGFLVCLVAKRLPRGLAEGIPLG